MKTKFIPKLTFVMLLTLCFSFPTILSSQAPSEPAPPPATPQDLSGAWILNHSQSDDPDEKMKGREEDIPFNGPNSPGANVPPNAANTPSAGGRRSGPRTGGAGPLGGPVGSVDSTDKDREGTLRLLRPSDSLTVAAGQNEFDLTDDDGRKRVFFTDGRKLNKSKDDKYQEIAAQWKAGRLVSDEKGPRNAKLSRTFELSRDGHQFYETILLDNSKIFSPIVIRYVYDPAPPPKQP
jgi:hypothetical protein